MSIKEDEGGFTLIELLVTIVIVGVVMTALGGAVISIIHNSNVTTQTLTQSHDAQITAAYFANDIQSSDVNGAVDASLFSTDSRCDQGRTPVLRVAWTEYNSSNSVVAYKLVSYNLVSSGSSKILKRSFCQGATSASLSGTPVSDLSMSSNVSTTTPPTTSITSCNGFPKTVVLTITEQAVPLANTYTFQVSGTRREATC